MARRRREYETDSDRFAWKMCESVGAFSIRFSWKFCGGEEFHVLRILVDRVFAELQGDLPDAALADGNEFAVLVIVAAEIVTFRAGVADYHADIADTDLGFFAQFNRGEQSVDIVGALD